jgi:hypothetical protein
VRTHIASVQEERMTSIVRAAVVFRIVGPRAPAPEAAQT